jgi:hypothetical protein
MPSLQLSQPHNLQSPHGRSYQRAVELNNTANRLDQIKAHLALLLRQGHLKDLPPAAVCDILAAGRHLNRASTTTRAAVSLYSSRPSTS